MREGTPPFCAFISLFSLVSPAPRVEVAPASFAPLVTSAPPSRKRPTRPRCEPTGNHAQAVRARPPCQHHRSHKRPDTWAPPTVPHGLDGHAGIFIPPLARGEHLGKGAGQLAGVVFDHPHASSAASHSEPKGKTSLKTRYKSAPPTPSTLDAPTSNS